MAELTLDIPDPQVIISFPDDEDGFTWHHRIFLKKISGGRWVTLTPDLEIQRHDFERMEHIPLDRAAPFPTAQAAFVYAHDPISTSALAAFKRRAALTAAILGDGGVLPVEEWIWVISDPLRDDFGERVDDIFLQDPNACLTFDLRGVLRLEGEEVFIERVMKDDLKVCKDKVSSERADVRLLGDHRDRAGRRRLPLSDAVALVRSSDIPDFGLEGLRALA